MQEAKAPGYRPGADTSKYAILLWGSSRYARFDLPVLRGRMVVSMMRVRELGVHIGRQYTHVDRISQVRIVSSSDSQNRKQNLFVYKEN